MHKAEPVEEKKKKQQPKGCEEEEEEEEQSCPHQWGLALALALAYTIKKREVDWSENTRRKKGIYVDSGVGG